MPYWMKKKRSTRMSIEKTIIICITLVCLAMTSCAAYVSKHTKDYPSLECVKAGGEWIRDYNIEYYKGFCSKKSD